MLQVVSERCGGRTTCVMDTVSKATSPTRFHVACHVDPRGKQQDHVGHPRGWDRVPGHGQAASRVHRNLSTRQERMATKRSFFSLLRWRRNSEGPSRRRARCRARPWASCGFARFRMRRWMLDVHECGIRGVRSMFRRLHLLLSSNLSHTIHESHARYETILFTFPSTKNPHCVSNKSSWFRLRPIGTLPMDPSIHPLVKVNGVAFQTKWDNGGWDQRKCHASDSQCQVNGGEEWTHAHGRGSDG